MNETNVIIMLITLISHEKYGVQTNECKQND